MPWWIYLIIAWVIVGWLTVFLVEREDHKNEDFKVKHLLIVVFAGGILGSFLTIAIIFLALCDGIEKFGNITIMKGKAERERIALEKDRD